MSTVAEVRLWGTQIGAVSHDDGDNYCTFQYSPDFVASNIDIAPLVMPLRKEPYRFVNLPFATFHGLPGLLADSLPDKFGNMLIDTWLATEGRTPDSFNAVERLCYSGTRGMGGLEFFPVKGPRISKSQLLEVERLVELASEILTQRGQFTSTLQEDGEGLEQILRIGTSAGGARAKAIIAWSEKTGQVRSGQVDAPKGYSYWLMKFDGVAENRDKELADPKGYGAIEYGYSLMAKEAGIEMTECRLFTENDRNHFMTRRFDRLENGQKLHMSTLCGMAHFDYNNPLAHSYEQAFMVMRKLELPMEQLEQFFLRMVFNILARNQDDHVKNISFLMGRTGRWSLSPAYDLTYCYNPGGLWTSQHQMSMNNKRDQFTLKDFIECGRTAGLMRSRPKEIVELVASVVKDWRKFAEVAGVQQNFAEEIGRNHRKIR